MAAYLVELYLSRMGADGLPQAAARAQAAAAQLAGEGVDVRYIRSIFVPKDETWFLVYESDSAVTVGRALERAAITGGRVIEAVTQP